MHIDRVYSDKIKKALFNDRKVVLLFGARQTGKTTIINRMLDSLKGNMLRINDDQIKYIDILSSRDFSKMRLLLEG
ncbi:MAG: AAA family ATPase, partial [Bacteroidales bacterium]|nr:AAA family ATPase [Bacteroidales bacterium]